MRVAFIEDTHLRGGTQIWVAEAVRDFLSQGVEVTVIAPEGGFVHESCGEAGATLAGYDFQKIATTPDLYKQCWMEALAPCQVAVTTVHPPRDGFHCCVFAASCIRDGGLNTVLVPKTGSIVPWYKREYYHPDHEVKTRVVCITGFTRNYLIESYGIAPDMIELIYQGTELSRFSRNKEAAQEARRRYPLTGEAAPVIGSVGAMEPRKGQVILLQALKLLLDSGRLPNAHVMFVGEGPDEAMLRAVSSVYGLERHVSFFPFTNEPDFVFERIDLLAFPSLYKEGLPNVLLEAMAMEIPVVSTPLAGIPEIIHDGETGWLFPPGDVERLADIIETVWNNPDCRREAGIRARELVGGSMDKKKQFGVFLDCFRRLSQQ